MKRVETPSETQQIWDLDCSERPETVSVALLDRLDDHPLVAKSEELFQAHRGIRIRRLGGLNVTLSKPLRAS